jgi:folate-binding protein YgfZ
MDPQLTQSPTPRGACVNLSTRAKWRLSGADRVRYLNGQVTNDVRRASSREVLYACVTNAKGKIDGDIHIHASPDGTALLLDSEPGLRESLSLRLAKYIISDDAELEDVSDDWQLWHVLGGDAAITEAQGGHIVAADRFRAPGIDVWLPAKTKFEPPCTVLSADEIEALRILRHIPKHPQELNAETFPQEAGLESRAMNFSKGCYIGQEILSRIKTTGKMPRNLIAWSANSGAMQVSSGDALFNEADQKAIGSVTSVTRHPQTGIATGLAYVRQGYAVPDSVLLVGADVPRIDAIVTVIPLVQP